MVMQDSKDLYTFVPNKLFVQLLNISLKKFVFLKTFHSKVSCVGLLIKTLNG